MAVDVIQQPAPLLQLLVPVAAPRTGATTK